MRRVAIRGLLARKLRSALTAVAIVLGVAMVSGTLVLTDTIEKAFDSIFSSSYEQTDAVVSGKKLVEWSQTGKATVSPEILGRIQALPEVEAAAGTILDLSGDANQAKILDKQGEAIQGNNPTFGLGVNPEDERFNPFRLVEGDWASGPNEVVIDVSTADAEGFRVGEQVKVAGEGPVRSFTLAGIVRFGDVDSLGGATIALFDIATARQVLDKPGFDAVAVAARDGVSTEKLVDSIALALPDSAEVKSGSEQAAEDGEGVGEFVKFIRYFLLAFGGIALFVGAFVIFNTLSITVAQRTKELATLRTLGASRRQVLAFGHPRRGDPRRRRLGRRARVRRPDREGADGADARGRARPPAGEHGLRDANGGRRDVDGHPRHPRRVRLAGGARDANRADRCGARRRDGREEAVAEVARRRARPDGARRVRARLRDARQ